jgi:hypothetical protein
VLRQLSAKFGGETVGSTNWQHRGQNQGQPDGEAGDLPDHQTNPLINLKWIFALLAGRIAGGGMVFEKVFWGVLSPPGCKKLKGRDGWRIRQGNYRIIYDIFDEILVVEIVAVGHRKDIYN